MHDLHASIVNVNTQRFSTNNISITEEHSIGANAELPTPSNIESLLQGKAFCLHLTELVCSSKGSKIDFKLKHPNSQSVRVTPLEQSVLEREKIPSQEVELTNLDDACYPAKIYKKVGHGHGEESLQ